MVLLALEVPAGVAPERNFEERVEGPAERALGAEIGRYEKAVGAKPKLVLFSPFIDEKALEPARSLGIATSLPARLLAAETAL